MFYFLLSGFNPLKRLLKSFERFNPLLSRQNSIALKFSWIKYLFVRMANSHSNKELFNNVLSIKILISLSQTIIENFPASKAPKVFNSFHLIKTRAIFAFISLEKKKKNQKSTTGFTSKKLKWQTHQKLAYKRETSIQRAKSRVASRRRAKSSPELCTGSIHPVTQTRNKCIYACTFENSPARIFPISPANLGEARLARGFCRPWIKIYDSEKEEKSYAG